MACRAYADTSATWTSGATSLADGKISIAYDESGAITDLAMVPDGDETLTMNGAAVTFADGAHIQPSGDGVSRIENSFTAAGGIVLGATNLSYVGSSTISSSEYVTLFTGVRLNDYSPTVADSSGAGSGSGNADYLPCHVRRGDGWLTSEFRYLVWSDSSSRWYEKRFRLDLRQDGDSIVAMRTAGGYWETSTTNREGWAMLDGNPKFGVTTAGYTTKRLQLAPRVETYDWIAESGTYLTDSFETVVATNATLDDIEILYGVSGYNAAISGIGQATMYPHHVTLTNGVLSAQLWNLTSSAGSLKCVKVELAQRGADIVARRAYGAYAPDTNEEYDFDDFDSGYVWDDGIALRQSRYKLDALSLRRKTPTKRNLTFATTGTRKLGAVSGNAVRATFEAPAGASASVTLDATNECTLANGVYVVTNASGRSFFFNVYHKNALPVGRTDAYGSATYIDIQVNAGTTSGINGGYAEIGVHDGASLRARKDNCFNYNRQPVVVDNAKIWTYGTVASYYNDLMLTNGGRVARASADADCYFRMGYSPSAKKRLFVAGTGACSCDARIQLLGGASGAERDVTIEVEDVVSGDGVDFTMNGDIDVHEKYPNPNLVKSGPGTMEMYGTIRNASGRTRVENGVLRFAVSDVTTSDETLALAGGTLALAAGTSNAASALSVSDAATLAVEAGATLTLGDLAVADEAALAVSGDGIVVVTSCLSRETLAKIRLNGKRVQQSASGRLFLSGLVISIL